MAPWYIEVLGIIPTILYPTGRILQIHKLWKKRKTDEISLINWILFAFANLSSLGYCVYFKAWVMSLCCILAGSLDVVMIVSIIVLRKEERKSNQVERSDQCV